ncbi:MAG: hypothetical protein H7A36_07065 [Chlamydiales bacterium]|nr:hypothetical protein [Chlamydiales bacterium]
MTVSDRPDLLKQWSHANAYFGLRPETTPLGSEKVVLWTDSEGNFFRRSVCDLAREAPPVSVSGGSGGPQEGVCKVAASALSPQGVAPEAPGAPARKVRRITRPPLLPQGVAPEDPGEPARRVRRIMTPTSPPQGVAPEDPGEPARKVRRIMTPTSPPQGVAPEDPGAPARRVRRITTPTSPPQDVAPAVLSQKKASPLPVPDSVINSYIFSCWDKGRNDKVGRFAAEISTDSELFAYWNFGGEIKIRRVCDVFMCGVAGLTN